MVDVYTEITVTIRLNFGNSNKRQRKALSLKIVTVVKAVEMLGTDHGFLLSNYGHPSTAPRGTPCQTRGTHCQTATRGNDEPHARGNARLWPPSWQCG